MFDLWQHFNIEHRLCWNINFQCNYARGFRVKLQACSTEGQDSDKIGTRHRLDMRQDIDWTWDRDKRQRGTRNRDNRLGHQTGTTDRDNKGQQTVTRNWTVFWNISRTSIDLIKYYLNNLDIDALVLSKMVAVQDNQGLKYWSCNDCDYMKRSKGDVFKHVERKHVDLEVHCVYCHLVYKSRPELLTHVKAKHPSA